MTDLESLVAVGVIAIPLFAMWFLALFNILVRRRDLSIGWKGIWSAVVIMIPYIGLLVYVIVRPPAPAKGSRDDDPTATRRAIDDIHRLVSDHDAAVVTEAQFAAQKATVFGIGEPATHGSALSPGEVSG